jgi:hypothetical protein
MEKPTEENIKFVEETVKPVEEIVKPAEEPVKVKKPRGRPRKNPLNTDTPKRPRGRPKKNPNDPPKIRNITDKPLGRPKIYESYAECIKQHLLNDRKKRLEYHQALKDGTKDPNEIKLQKKVRISTQNMTPEEKKEHFLNTLKEYNDRRRTLRKLYGISAGKERGLRSASFERAELVKQEASEKAELLEIIQLIKKHRDEDQVKFSEIGKLIKNFKELNRPIINIDPK